MGFFKQIYLSRWFFLLFFTAVLLYGLSSILPIVEFPSKVLFIGLFSLTLLDLVLLFLPKKPLSAERIVADRLQLGDSNNIQLVVKNNTKQPLAFRLYEGYPVELQIRDKFFHKKILSPGKTHVFQYDFEPKQRGDLFFTDPFFIISSVFQLCMRRYEVPLKQKVAVYPSIDQMKKYELLVFSQKKVQTGVKRIRRLGNNSEFEQIKNYVQGDELRTINWKATSRTNNLMVNKYQEEKSQSIYCILDKSRSMQMEFDDLSLLDYSINSILVLSNIMLKNGDKTGLMTFSDKIGTQLIADKSTVQLRSIMNALYNQKTAFKDPNYELLYQNIRRTIKQRSLIVLFTNFETEASLQRALPILRKINQHHVLLTVLFQNSDLETLSLQKPTSMREVYQSIVVEEMSELKSKIALQLKQNGIQTILTLPEHLSIQTINKYLELKAKGIL